MIGFEGALRVDDKKELICEKLGELYRIGKYFRRCYEPDSGGMQSGIKNFKRI